jgi:hypothetical protein
MKIGLKHNAITASSILVFFLIISCHKYYERNGHTSF